MADTAVPLNIVQGASLALSVTVAGGVAKWAGGVAVKGEVRDAVTGALLLSLTPYLVASVVGPDRVATLTLTGVQTRLVTSLSKYDIFMSEPGTTFANSVRVAYGPVTVEKAVTA